MLPILASSLCRSRTRLLAYGSIWSRQIENLAPADQKRDRKAYHQINYNVYPHIPLRQIDSISGWMPPLDSPPPLPFRINRSKTNNIPVYSEIRKGRTLHLTIIRKIEGDLHAVKEGLKRLLGEDVQIQINEVNSQIIIKGKHVKPITKWLLLLGF
ncbi:39S ribosomal protein L49, mitochondrial [Trichoplax sp. H2]|nr:39S ribosomal protein L49, mitochondrial [Trichoplax sp. H2]|eukprot:RDD47378.1 39S ribosomal protein L49, mitochondrial [Trichoplax sp. H2]